MSEEIMIEENNLVLNGLLTKPLEASSIVIFAHGSGSSRHSQRNQFAATILNRVNIATLLFDLLTQQEEMIDDVTREFRFNIPLLAQRLMTVTQWVIKQKQFLNFKIGYFGASTGAGAALLAASQQKAASIQAVVSRGGRPDLAGPALSEVTSPTLMIVGSEDPEVIQLNKQAMAQMTCAVKLEIVPGASHLFEEEGTLESAANLARDWFVSYLK